MRVALCRRHSGHRFMSMIEEAFKALGHDTMWIELESIKTESELIQKIRNYSPDFLFSLTANPQLTESIPEEYLIIHYELDKIMSEKVLKNTRFKHRDIIFSTYKNDCDAFRNAGAGKVQYLPFFFNAKESTTDFAEIYPVSFVGTLGQNSDYKWYLSELRDMVKNNTQASNLLENGVIPFCEQLLSVQENAFEQNEYLLPVIIKKNIHGQVLALMETFNISPLRCLLLLSKEAAFRQRYYYLNPIKELHTWGPEEWSQVSWDTNHYEGTALLHEDTAAIYKKSIINLNIQRIYAQDGLSDRVFNVMMAGGFLLADRNDSIKELFTEGVHVELFDTRSEMLEKIEFYKNNSEKRKEIAYNGQKEVLANHSCLNRIEHIISEIPN